LRNAAEAYQQATEYNEARLRALKQRDLAEARENLALKEYPYKDIDTIEKLLINNHFENYGNSFESDGAIVFRPDMTFTLWGARGTWKVLSPSTFEIGFDGDMETYTFMNYDPTNAICIDHGNVAPMRIVMDNSIVEEPELQALYVQDLSS